MTTRDEDTYITQLELDKAHQERRDRQLESLRLEERDGIALELATSDEVAMEALELGFDRATARVMPLVPLIEVAWSDGSISDAEAAKVLEVAKDRGIVDVFAIEFLGMLLEKRPSKLYFERVNRVLHHLVEEDPSNPETRDVLKQSKAVAEASGGFFGLTSAVGSEEAAMLEELAKILSVD